MPYYEKVGNLHIHTRHSDGTGDVSEIAAAASQACLDFVIITDHNVYNPQEAGWRQGVLVLEGEEIHDPEREHANHYLVLNAGEDLTPYRGDPQALIDAGRERGALGYIAHPFERGGRVVAKEAINWVDWDVSGYTGLEIWNYMSEFKARLTSWPAALLHVFAPKLAIRGPFPQTLWKWDSLLAERRVFAIGGSDAHAQTYHLGPLGRQVYPYEHLFRSVNTHILVAENWQGDLEADARLVYEALASGRSFVAYDGLASARGFDFAAETPQRRYEMGSEVPSDGFVRLRVRTPAPAYIRLLRDGQKVVEGRGRQIVYGTRDSGVYRVEAYRRYGLRRRGWIYSNPIFVQ